MKLYNLTELGPDWGWGLRAVEIVGQTLALLVIVPVVAVHNVTGWIMEKTLP